MTKTISLADDAYEVLSRARRRGESFSDVARRLAKAATGGSLLDPDVRFKMSRKEAKDWIGRIYRERERSMKPRRDVE